MSGLKLRNVKKAFGKAEVIHGVDLDIESGEFVVLVGPSGCGKSTLLRMISGLEETTSGTIHIGDSDMTEVDPADRGVAMVFQSYALYPHMSVRDNIGFGLRMSGMAKDEVAKRVNEAAATLELSELLDRKPKALSGGQRQRVAIGRAIVRQPEVFLFDEPLSNLDAELRVQMRLEIAKLHHRLKATMVFVTHDQVEAMTLADRIVVLRSGRVEQVGSPIELYDNPANQFVAGFIGSPRMNFLPATVTGTETGHARVSLQDFPGTEISVATTKPCEVGASVTVGIRPEHFVAEGTAPVRLKTDVQVVEQLGGASCIYVTSEAGSQLTVQLPGHAPVKAGETYPLGLDPAACFLFDAGGERL